jgi:hypothetical protein
MCSIKPIESPFCKRERLESIAAAQAMAVRFHPFYPLCIIAGPGPWIDTYSSTGPNYRYYRFLTDLKKDRRGFRKPDSTLDIRLCGHVRLVLIPNFFRQKLGTPQAECLVFEPSIKFEQEYGSTTNLWH